MPSSWAASGFHPPSILLRLATAGVSIASDAAHADARCDADGLGDLGKACRGPIAAAVGMMPPVAWPRPGFRRNGPNAPSGWADVQQPLHRRADVVSRRSTASEGRRDDPHEPCPGPSLEPPTGRGIGISAGLAAVGLAGCKPHQAQGYVPPTPPGVAVFRWSRPSDADVAAATYGSNRYTIPPADVNDDAGIIEHIEATYDPTADIVTWLVTIGPQPDDNPWHDTQGFWLVLSDGPMPRSLGGDVPLFLFDASGPQPELTAYVYNGKGDGSSWAEGPAGGPAEPIVSSLQGPGVLEVGVLHEGDATTMFFTVDASLLNDFVPAPSSASHWNGLSFDHHIGLWFHPLTNVTSAYDADGWLVQYDYERTGWLDGTNFFVDRTAACCLPDGTCLDLMPDVCIAQGGQPLEDASSCATTSCGVQFLDCCEQDKPTALTLQYVGGGCDDSSHGQDAKKAKCEGDDVFAPSVRILATDRSSPDASKAKVWFEGEVLLDGTFTISAANAGEDKFKSNTWLHLLDPIDGTPLQSLSIHTSCSQPLAAGDRFASIRVIGCGEEPDDRGPDCCEQEKPTALIMQYVGGGCDDLQHGQDDGKVSCAGDPLELASVLVFATDDEDPAGRDRVYFDGPVDLDGTFTISAAAAGEDKFKSATFVHFFDVDGTWLQSVEFHTSCSQPLAEGDRFGSIVLVGCGDAEDPGQPPLVDCCESDKPIALLMQFVGGGCDEMANAQDAGKVSCSGDAIDLSAVHVVATDDEDPADRDRVYFDGIVDLDGTFTVGAAAAGEDKFKSTTFVHFFDVDGTCCSRWSSTRRARSRWPRATGSEASCSSAAATRGIRASRRSSTAATPVSRRRSRSSTPASTAARRAALRTRRSSRATTSRSSAGPRHVEASAGKSGDADYAATVVVGDVFVVAPLDGKMSNETVIRAYDAPGGTLLQEVRFHTSCSQPLGLGDRFGEFRLVACNEPPAGGAPQAAAPPEPADACDAGKPAALTFRYDGAGCDATSHAQARKRVSCTGDARMEPAVRIVVTNRRNHEHPKARVYFDGMVLLQDVFTAEAARADRRRLTNRTFVLVYDLAGELVQEIELHTSCSQPLRLGDQFGAVVLEAFVAE